ncbi:MAG: SET domain-containing protein-lysine N-methyltransferase [Caldilineaceae bacterium]
MDAQGYKVVKLQVVQHPLKGRIVIAAANYARDEVVCIGRPTGIAPQRDTHSMQIEEENHVWLDEPAQLFSHSCAPNLYLRNNEYGAYTFYAARAIAAQEELTFHYGMSEAHSIAVAVCACGAANCLGRSVGFKDAPKDVQGWLYQLGIANYLRRWYEGGRH